jgi:RNA polymerase sigma factor (sigma-70 family)
MQYIETNQRTIKLTKELQDYSKELDSIIAKEKNSVDSSTGRYIGKNNRAKYLELAIDKLYNNLLEEYNGLVFCCVRIFHAPLADYDDIVRIAKIALFKGFKRYDPSVSKVTTFIMRTIMGEIKRYFRDNCWRWKVPRRLKEAASGKNNEIEELEIIAKKYGIEEDDLKQVREILRSNLSHEDYHDIQDESNHDAGYYLFQTLLTDEMLSKLSQIEKEALELRFIDNRSMADIADILFIEVGRAKKVIENATNKLKKYYEDKRG